MNRFLKMCIGILCCVGGAKFFSWGISAVNSSAADLFFGLGLISLMCGLYCFIGELFE
jgi:hypothetical protein